MSGGGGADGVWGAGGIGVGPRAARSHSRRVVYASASSVLSSSMTSSLASTLPCWSSLRLTPLFSFCSSSSICLSFFFRFLIFLPTSTSPSVSHLRISASTSDLASILESWSALSSTFSSLALASRTQMLPSRLRSALIFFSTSLAPCAAASAAGAASTATGAASSSASALASPPSGFFFLPRLRDLPFAAPGSTVSAPKTVPAGVVSLKRS
mmetsp:Transcript_64572/g.155771  ORF Transcript_64572/g.155771 Transcript_64572/m.155771 type:complete len:212 (-) Transcript_64572:174-809(-)